MTFKDRIEALGPGRWEIPLGTHLGSAIPNETSAFLGRLSLGRQKEEARYVSIFKQVREPVAGYNCYGQVFASRRTGIYSVDDFPIDKIIEMVLAEDGFGEIAYDDLRAGDVVVYSDEQGVDHVARIVGSAPRASLLVSDAEAQPTRSFLVRSKFDSVSGEYEHPLENTGWSSTKMERRYYRDRHQTPVKKGWRGIIARVEASPTD